MNGGARLNPLNAPLGGNDASHPVNQSRSYFYTELSRTYA